MQSTIKEVENGFEVSFVSAEGVEPIVDVFETLADAVAKVTEQLTPATSTDKAA